VKHKSSLSVSKKFQSRRDRILRAKGTFERVNFRWNFFPQEKAARKTEVSDGCKCSAAEDRAKQYKVIFMLSGHCDFIYHVPIWHFTCIGFVNLSISTDSIKQAVI